MTSPARRGRVLTVIAVGALCLDGVLLGLAGLWSSRPVLILIGAGLLLLAVCVVLLWRRHQRTLAEISAVRAEVRAEALAIRELIKRSEELEAED
jgi:HAMP domain-containing protein